MKKFENPEIEVTVFVAEDVLSTSPTVEDETPIG